MSALGLAGNRKEVGGEAVPEPHQPHSPLHTASVVVTFPDSHGEKGLWAEGSAGSGALYFTTVATRTWDLAFALVQAGLFFCPRQADWAPHQGVPVSHLCSLTARMLWGCPWCFCVLCLL